MSDLAYYAFVTFAWVVGGLSAIGYGWLMADALKGPPRLPEHPSKSVFPKGYQE